MRAFVPLIVGPALPPAPIGLSLLDQHAPGRCELAVDRSMPVRAGWLADKISVQLGRRISTSCQRTCWLTLVRRLPGDHPARSAALSSCVRAVRSRGVLSGRRSTQQASLIMHASSGYPILTAQKINTPLSRGHSRRASWPDSARPSVAPRSFSQLAGGGARTHDSSGLLGAQTSTRARPN